ncbi:acylphosphatase [Roseovarius aestuariivivens]|uniref:acylphosphatase n=1 Tax=Roseovarius aestuariivivens TaxID=1888910 RepID=UPI001080D7E2|nr:acylphosphatase [Roseovarius aestuariivivens]
MHNQTTLTGVQITGTVQGVGFRAWTQDEATARGLRGWVKNEEDGSVRAVLSGPEDAVADMLRALETGPAAAEVTAVLPEPAEAPENTGFEIRR